MANTSKNSDFISMDVYLQTFKKHFIGFILVVVAVVALIGGYGNFVKDKLYESKVVLSSSYVNSEGNNLTGSQINYNQAQMNDLQNYIVSDAVMNSVSQKVNMDSASIASTLTFEHKEDSAYVTVTCRADSSKKAYQIIQEITKYIEDNMSHTDFKIVVSQRASLNKGQVSPQMGTYYKFAIVMGLALGCVYIVLRAQY